jgi:hypothetical protein
MTLATMNTCFILVLPFLGIIARRETFDACSRFPPMRLTLFVYQAAPTAELNKAEYRLQALKSLLI